MKYVKRLWLGFWAVLRDLVFLVIVAIEEFRGGKHDKLSWNPIDVLKR